MNLTALLKKQWLLLFLPLVVFGWNMLYTFSHVSAPALAPVKKEADAQRVVRVYEGLCDIDGKGESRSPLAALMLTVWVRNFDGWLHDRIKNYPKTFTDGGYSAQELEAYWAKDPDMRTPDEKDKFNTWMRDSLAKVRLTIGSVVFETMQPDPVLSTSVQVKAQNAEDYTWTRLAFCKLQPDGDEALKMKQLVQLYGSECGAPISISFPFLNAKEKENYVTMSSLVNEGAPTQRQDFSLPLRPRVMRALAWSALSAVLLFLVSVSTQTGVLRETVPAASTVIPDWTVSPWSTSRVVFAWWLAICTACYLFLWAMQGSMNVLSGSAPLLLGINGGTLLAATWVADSKRKKAQAAADADGADLTPIPTRGFLTDVVSEGQDAEVSKLQMLVWNGVLGVVFIWQSLSNWEMPTFNENLMTLLGISSTAYVGYKAAK
ncbi:hypothetical protein [Prosthecobacter vanneervenii]|uniref:Uncharacterized protein n=1 Tax=Prosthecobacter vanneervenii TaxID=48466 RepID=A0A7W7Y8F7_9BACT|nr:hypothetical protein [Prosthecobacter vanneervenii]MBB5031526.1 hypothetical protein [Prosthecobacter vanneervenii]